MPDKQQVRCPGCQNIVAMAEGPRIVSRIAVRGRSRREVVAFDKAEFLCDHCGERFEYICAPSGKQPPPVMVAA